MATITILDGKSRTVREYQEADFDDAFREAQFYHGLLAMRADVTLSQSLKPRGFDITYSDGSQVRLAE